MENNMTTGRKLDNSSSFHQQKEYVESLPKISEDDDLNRTVFAIKDKTTPFDVDPNQLPDKMDVSVFHHAVTDENDKDSDEEDKEFKSSTAVVSRQLKITNRKKTETLIMHVPDEKSETSQTFQLKFKADGTVSVRKKNAAMTSLQKDLLLEDGKKQAGIVVVAHDTEKDEHRYSAFTRGS
jgi:hypothetical protein